MITIIWVATGVAVLGSIELLARAATAERSAAKVRERDHRTRHA